MGNGKLRTEDWGLRTEDWGLSKKKMLSPETSALSTEERTGD
jgi:uncharacterized protein (DUF2141 family)